MGRSGLGVVVDVVDVGDVVDVMGVWERVIDGHGVV